MLKTFTGIFLLAIQLLGSQTTVAATLYHCGNSYQDTPCKGEVNSNPIKKIAVQNTNSQTSNENQPILKIDSDCKQRGEAAKKIMWAREVGKTADQQIESAQDSYTQTLVREVYNHRGSPLDVKNTIEQDCMMQKEQDKLAGKLIIEAQRLRGGRNISLDASNNNNVQLKTASTEVTIDETENHTNRNGNPTHCATLKSNTESIADKRRKGGGASYMNDLKQKQDQLESEMRSSGC